MAKDKFYFQHDSNARNDLRILSLRQIMGWEGYGLYWAMLEILRDQDGYKIPSSCQGSLMLGLSLDEDRLKDFISNCLSLGLLVEKDGFLYSNSFLVRMSEIDERRMKLSEAGRRGGINSSHAKATLNQPSSSKANKSKVNKNKTNIYDFSLIWSTYPKQDGKKAAERSFYASVKSEKDWEDIHIALNNYLKSEAVNKGFIKNGSTWFNNWRDWVNISNHKEDTYEKLRRHKDESNKTIDEYRKSQRGTRVEPSLYASGSSSNGGQENHVSQ
jgi:hypothetical protein